MKTKFTFLFVLAMFVVGGMSAQTLSSVKSSALPATDKADVEIHYDSDNANAIGTNSEAVFSVLARFTSDELSDYYGGNAITKVRFYINGTVATGTKVLIYGNGSAAAPGELLFEEVTAAPAEGWNEHTLSTAVQLTEGDYWVGYEVKTTGAHPAGCDAGPMVANKGGWITLDGAQWSQLSDYGLDGNWNVRATVSTSTGIESELQLASFAFGGNGTITINADSAQIFNAAGQLVRTSNASTIQIPAGVYFVRVGKNVAKVLVK